MDQKEIAKIIKEIESTKKRNIVIVDFGNVEKWKENLGWKIGIKQLSQLIKHFSSGSKFLRRFYYGSDYGPSTKSTELTPWSKGMLEKAKMGGFKLITKRVKYIPIGPEEYLPKCDFDVEMAIDLVKEKDNYDNIILFCGDGDLAYALEYMGTVHGKGVIVFAARGHLGQELIDAKNSGVVQKILFADDFNYRLDLDRFPN